MQYSYVAVMTNDRFYPGLCAVHYSLKKVNAKYPLAVVVPTSMPASTKKLIDDLGITRIEMAEIPLSSSLLERNTMKKWNPTIFKLNIFNLLQYDKIVFLDLDMIILKNIDELFDMPHMSCVAAGHCLHESWTGLNSGMMVIEPNAEVFNGLLSCCTAACEARLRSGVGFGDQDVVNYLYPDWYDHSELVLPEIYNCLCDCIQTLSKEYGFESLKILHFAEGAKPWQHTWWSYCIYFAKRVVKREWLKLKAFFIYRKYVKESCPDYSRYR